ncbi:MAG: hypothetical protein CXZ00_01930 [Acidobacteria bacterium]|nr:MAG: hypothetical protein CXZ00_01930 [Acidobacteriota bacterium]
MGCCSGPGAHLFARINNEIVILKGLAHTFESLRARRGLRPTSPNLGSTLVEAVRQAGNDIPAELEQDYATVLIEVFMRYCESGQLCQYSAV